MPREVELEVPCPREGCEETLLFEAEVDPGDPNYGADADGNRGIYVGPSLQAPTWAGETCEQAHLYDEGEIEALNDSLRQAAADYRYEPPDPDDYL